MPRTAEATPHATLDQLIERGRYQGHLSLAELRDAFAQAGVSPSEGRTILRELSEAGVSLAAENEPSLSKTAPSNTRKTTEPASAEEDAPKKPSPSRTKATGRKPAKAKTTVRNGAAKNTGMSTGGPVDGKPEHEEDVPDDIVLDEAEIEHEQADLDDTQSVMGDSVHTYLKSIGRRTLLTAAQEVELARRIEAGLYAEYKLETHPDLPADVRDDLHLVVQDGRRAKDHMLEANLRLVVSVAKKYTDRGMSLLDVVQEGNLGLIRAVEKFDYTKGFKFSTYATWWVRQSISRGIAQQGRIVRLPVHVAEQVNQVSAVRRTLERRLGREPELVEIAAELGVAEEQVIDLLRLSRDHVSLDAPVEEDGDTALGDLLAREMSPGPDEVVLDAEDRARLDAMLASLDERSADVVRRRYGLLDGRQAKLADIAAIWGITAERVRQIERHAISKLRGDSEAA